MLSLFAYSLSISFLKADDRWIGLLIEIVLVAFAMVRKERRLVLLAFVSASILVLTLIPITSQWPLPSLLATGAIGGVLWFKKIPFLKAESQILDRREILLSLLVTALSILGVLLWFLILKPSLEQTPFHLPLLSKPLLVLFLILFSAVNAFAEEFLFRGVALEALMISQAPWIANLLQAIAFGFLHYAGFPFGFVGMIMGFLFGLMMGYLRLRTRGLLSPWMAHFITDLGIAALFLFRVQ